MNARGFTLIEVLVAIALTAAAMTLAWRALSAVITTSDHGSRQVEIARDADALFGRLEREILQRAPEGAAQFSGGEGVLSFHSLADAPAGQPVEYRLKDRQLRLATPSSEAVLFDEVDAFELRFMGPDFQWVSRWPGLAADPRAIEVRFKRGRFDVTRVFALP